MEGRTLAARRGPLTAGASEVLARSEHRLIIGGRRLAAASGETYEIFDPSSGEPIGRVALSGPEDVDRAVSAARKAFDEGPWRRIAPLERGRLLDRLADLLEEKFDPLAELEALNGGKPIGDARTYDIPQTIEHFRYYAGWPGKLLGETIPVPGEALVYTLREPVGVVGQIIPWNFPLMLAAWKVAPALAAGCTVVLKPAPETPLTALVLAELAFEAGIPEGVFNVVTGGAEPGAALASHPDVDKVAFTGSTEVGREIVRASAGNLKRLSLELGGKSPHVILADADLQRAAGAAADAIFYNSGQCCVAGSRLYVERSAFDRVVGAVADRARSLRVGPSLEESTEMGPLISATHLDRVTRYVAAGSEEGGRVVAGGGRPAGVPEGGYYLEPTVFVDVDDRVRIAREEVFGPVLVAQPFETLEEVARRANDTIYGLAAGVFTRDVARAHKLAALLRAGTVWINSYMAGDSAVPTGGMKQSGYGRDRGRQGIEGYLEDKVVWTGLG